MGLILRYTRSLSSAYINSIGAQYVQIPSASKLESLRAIAAARLSLHSSFSAQ